MINSLYAAYMEHFVFQMEFKSLDSVIFYHNKAYEFDHNRCRHLREARSKIFVPAHGLKLLKTKVDTNMAAAMKKLLYLLP